jgi:hypothetical protein
MQEKFGKEAFNIIPDTYILPDEFADFYSHFHSLRSKEEKNMWIIKPQNSSQGRGIYIVSVTTIDDIILFRSTISLKFPSMRTVSSVGMCTIHSSLMA